MKTKNRLNQIRFFILFLLFPFHTRAQPVTDYNQLILSQLGKETKSTFVSAVTGSKTRVLVKTGVWEYYSASKVLLKREEYGNPINGMATRVGVWNYFDEDGSPLLTYIYDRGEQKNAEFFADVRIIDGNRSMEIVRFDTLVRVKTFARDHLISEEFYFDGTILKKRASGKRDLSKEEVKQYAEKFEKDFPNEYRDTDNEKKYPENTNLISNPGFEILKKADQKTIYGVKDEVLDWHQAGGSPDLYVGTEKERNGKVMLGFRVFTLSKHIEYLANELTQPLKKDSLYCVRVHLKLSEFSSFATDAIGIAFTHYRPYYYDYTPGMDKSPDLITPVGIPFKLKSGWMIFNCIYKAKGGEKYFSIGGYRAVKEIKVIRVDGNQSEAYYYIDDVGLFPVRNEKDCLCNLIPSVDKKIKDTLPLLKDTTRYIVLDRIFFNNDEFELLPVSMEAIHEFYDFLKSNPDLKIELSGHTSNVGSAERNRYLSFKRTESVKMYLEKLGIEPNRIKTIGYGPDKPIASNNNEEGRSKNRRVEFRVISP